MQINKLLAHSSNYIKGRTGSIQYIVIHYTANNGDTAKGNCNYFAAANKNASAHYFVDENDIYQSVEDSNTAWHCGTTGTYYSKCRNSTSIGVELCSRKDSKGNYYFMDKTVCNAVELVKTLMDRYNVPKEKVIRHYDVTHKICPAPFVNNTVAWGNFKKRLEDKKIADTYDEAIKVLIDNGVISTRDYWDNCIKTTRYVEQLIINMANKLV